MQASREWDKANSGCEIMQSQEEETFLYFAYGSNLMSERIHLHNPSATFCYVARLQVSAARRAPATLCPLHRRGAQDSESSHGGQECSSS